MLVCAWYMLSYYYFRRNWLRFKFAFDILDLTLNASWGFCYGFSRANWYLGLYFMLIIEILACILCYFWYLGLMLYAYFWYLGLMLYAHCDILAWCSCLFWYFGLMLCASFVFLMCKLTTCSAWSLILRTFECFSSSLYHFGLCISWLLVATRGLAMHSTNWYNFLVFPRGLGLVLINITHQYHPSLSSTTHLIVYSIPTYRLYLTLPLLFLFHSLKYDVFTVFFLV